MIQPNARALTIDFQVDYTVQDSNSIVIHGACKCAVVCSVDFKCNVACIHLIGQLSGIFD